jgi:putative copper resistance protein D
VGGAAPEVKRRTALAGATLVVAAASVAAWALAYPQSSLPATLVRAVADCAAVVCLGLAVVPMLDDDRYRPELIRRATTPLSVAGAVWLVAELGRLIVAAAQAAAVPVWRLGVTTTVDFAVGTAAGRAGTLGVVAAAALCVATLWAPRTASVNVVVAGLAAVGVTARLITGHFFESALGGLAVAVHILAAALWCGALAGLVLTVEHRGQWARVLPRFSQLSLWCVLAGPPNHRRGIAVAVARRIGGDGRGARNGGRTGRHRLVPYPTWHDGGPLPVTEAHAGHAGDETLQRSSRWQTSRNDPTKGRSPRRRLGPRGWTHAQAGDRGPSRPHRRRPPPSRPQRNHR